MPRKHKRKLGSREYKNYTEETLQNALDDIESQTLSMRQAATRYNIPVATLSNKWNGKHVKKSGGQNVLTAREEGDLQSVLTSLSIWRYTDSSDESIPVTTFQQDTSELAGVFGVSEDGVSVGDWLLVNFAPEESRLKAYLGRVESITRRGNRKFEASFLRRKTQRLCDKDLFVFPDEEDVCAFSYQKVIGRVEAPEVLRRGVLKFSVDSHEW